MPSLCYKKFEQMKDLISQLSDRMLNLSRSRKMRVMWSSEFIAVDAYTLILTDKQKSGKLKKIMKELKWNMPSLDCIKILQCKKSSVHITWMLIENNKIFKNISNHVQYVYSRMIIPSKHKLTSNVQFLWLTWMKIYYLMLKFSEQVWTHLKYKYVLYYIFLF